MQCDRKICDVKGCQYPPNCEIPDKNHYGLGNKITKFKNRKINFEKPVYIYRNLRCGNNLNKRFSIRQNGLVRGYTNCILLNNCKFIVNKAGQKRVRKTGVKNVHAFIKGYLNKRGGMGMIANNQEACPANISYDPITDDYFVCKNLTAKPFFVKLAQTVVINNHGVTAAYVN